MNGRRFCLVIVVFLAGELCARLPSTIPGLVCGFCVAMLTGLTARGLMDSWDKVSEKGKTK